MSDEPDKDTIDILKRGKIVERMREMSKIAHLKARQISCGSYAIKMKYQLKGCIICGGENCPTPDCFILKMATAGMGQADDDQIQGSP